jgi:lipopolysaccharide transport system permease protein
VYAEYPRAIEDIYGGACQWRMWTRIGWQEVRRRYRRTVIGPFWTTLSLGIFVLSLGVVWARLWHTPLETYLPFVSAGIITWTLVSSLITDGCPIFVSNEGLIKQLQISFTLLVISAIWRNIVVFAHNLVILVIVFLWFWQPPGLDLLLIVPGLILLCINGAWMGLLCGMICARYRDLQQLIGSVLQVIIFVTPVFFMPDQLGRSRVYFVGLNPLFHLIDIVREPLLSKAPDAASWWFAVAFAVAGWWLTLVLFARFRRRVAFWL